MTTTIDKEAQKPATYPLVELFQLDTTTMGIPGGQVYYFTPMTSFISPENGWTEDYVKFGGITYQPFPIQTSGWEYSFDGAPPQPKLLVSNVNKLLQATVNSMGDLIGAKLTRIRTFMNFLDGQPNADAGQHFPKDIFYINQKTSHTKTIIEWSLISSVERSGVQLPLRQILPETGFLGVSRFRM